MSTPRDPSITATEIVRAFEESVNAGAKWDEAISRLRKKIQTAISDERSFCKSKLETAK